MNDWINDTTMASWWLEFEDLGWPDERLERKWTARAEAFGKAGINAAVIFGFHFRWDYVEIMDRAIGVIARIGEICNDHGIRLVGHHSAVFIHRVRSEQDRWNIRRMNNHHVPFYPDGEDVHFEGQKLSDWYQVSLKDDQPTYLENYNNRTFCPNNPDFQKAYLRLLERHLEKIDFAAIGCDDLSFRPDIYACGCKHCLERFEHEAGFRPPPVEEKDFWEDRSSPGLQQWIDFRYRSCTQFYAQVKEFLPEEVALWGCSSNIVVPRLADVGFSTRGWVDHWDAVAHEIYHEHQLSSESDRKTILADIAPYTTLAKLQDKPLVAIFYVKKPEDLPEWLDFAKQQNFIPWISKQVRIEDAVTEEQLLAGRNVAMDQKSNSGKSTACILFSYRKRDTLPEEEANAYVQGYYDLHHRLTKQGHAVDVFMDDDFDKVDSSQYAEVHEV